MDATTFQSQLAQEGFDTIVRVEREADGLWDDHTHPFEAKALIVSGEIRIRTADGAERTYREGDVFHLGREEPHAEWYGPQGVVYLVGRRGAPAA
ncbi:MULTISPECIES: cupin [unclassified Acidovorax]|uniref:cupin domain-containing protein n=1 Tax=unclassified Acidovorax TaxID=2684926 RepID=UPI0028830284|nr:MULTISPECIES: cupin [unclassified Acidovorax]